MITESDGPTQQTGVGRTLIRFAHSGLTQSALFLIHSNMHNGRMGTQGSFRSYKIRSLVLPDDVASFDVNGEKATLWTGFANVGSFGIVTNAHGNKLANTKGTFPQSTSFVVEKE